MNFIIAYFFEKLQSILLNENKEFNDIIVRSNTYVLFNGKYFVTKRIIWHIQII